MVKILWLKLRRDLRASLAQSLALIVVVALGISSFVALVGAFRDLGTSYNHTYDQLKFADVTFSLQGAPQSAANHVAQVRGVAAATGRLVVDLGLQLPAGAGPGDIRARLIGISPAQHPEVNDIQVTGGRFFQPEDGRAALVESHFAQAYNLRPGDQITPIVGGKPVAFTVVGIAASPEYLIVSPSKQELIPSARTFAVLFVPLAELQELTGAGDSINDVDVRFTLGVNQPALVADLQSRLQPYVLQGTTFQKDQPSNSALQLDLEGYREISYLMPVLILLVAALSVYVLLGRQVRAQQPQIGLMKALGYSSRAVMLDYLGVALTIGILGSSLGVLIGLPLAALITTSYAQELGIPLVETRFYPDLVGLGVLLSLAFSALAGIGPARSSAKPAPAEAMRLDPSIAVAKGGATIFESVIRLPLWLRLPVRDVFRVRSRALSTGIGVVFAFVLVLAAWGLLDSMNALLKRNFQVIERWDELALFSSPQTQNTLDEIKSWAGVRAAEPAVQLPATLDAHNQKQDILLTAFAPSETMHTLQLPPSLPPAQTLAPGRVVITTGLSRKLGLGIGDSLSLSSPFGTRQFKVSGTSDELMSAAAYISLAEAQEWMGAPALEFNTVFLTADAAQLTQIESNLYRLPNATSVQSRSNTQRDWTSLMGLFYAMIAVILTFAVATAFALLFNAMTVNVLERQRELATMRALGTSGRRIALLLTAESVILWLITLLPGLLLGTWAASEMGLAVSSDLFAFTIVISPSTYIWTALGILLTMILAALPAIRRVNRLNLAEATKVLT